MLCEEYNNSSEEKKQILEDKYTGHLTEKQMMRQEKENDIHQATEEKNGVVAMYDFQAVTPLPCGEISISTTKENRIYIISPFTKLSLKKGTVLCGTKVKMVEVLMKLVAV